MMRSLILAAALLAAIPAFAAEKQPDPLQIATGQTLSETVGALVQWRARAIADERQIADLQKQLDAARKPPTPAP